MKHIPRKRFGQNFLKDPAIIEAIVQSINPQTTDTIVEIGPGLGALTQKLLKANLYAVEVDRDCVAQLKNAFPQLMLFEADALSFDFTKIPAPFRLVGNLPYNISTPLLFHLMRFRNEIIDQHVMLQKEVVERMVASPSSKAYGRLSVMLQWQYDLEPVLDVPPKSFYPIPKVDSSVVRMTPKKHPLPCTYEALNQTLTAAFTKRRKTLRNALSGLFEMSAFSELGIDASLRPEDLTVSQFVALANHR